MSGGIEASDFGVQEDQFHERVVAYAIVEWIRGTKLFQYRKRSFGMQLKSVKESSSRLARWMLSLGEYDCYKPGRNHENADALSRGPIETMPDDAHSEHCSTDVEYLNKRMQLGNIEEGVPYQYRATPIVVLRESRLYRL